MSELGPPWVTREEIEDAGGTVEWLGQHGFDAAVGWKLVLDNNLQMAWLVFSPPLSDLHTDDE